VTKRRVVVTGLGVITPVGNDLKTVWDNVVAGNSGIGPITHFDISAYTTRFGGSIKDFDITEYLSAKEAKRMDPFIHYGMAASIQALKDSGILDSVEKHADRIGCALGAGIGGIKTIEDTHSVYLNSGPRRISPFFVPGTIINMISGYISIKYGLKGPNISIVTACTTATHNIGHAARIIAYGDADAMVAGGAEFATTPIGIGGFTAARALSTRNDDPEGASRPWDKERDGFVLSDGAASIMLEEYEFAKARGANIYAELAGFGMSGDAFHMTAPPESGDGARRCMEAAVSDAGMNPEDIDYINAHGTSTLSGDRAECEAIRHAFGNTADKLMVSSTKSITGHLLGAAGGIEAVISILSIRDGIVPPTINLDNPDEGCDLDFVPHTARQTEVNVALSNSFGFGGTNGTLVFRKV